MRTAARLDSRSCPGHGRGGDRPDRGIGGVERAEQGVDRPRDQQRGCGEARRVPRARRPRLQITGGVEAAHVSHRGPADGEGEPDDRNRVELEAGHDCDDGPRDGARDDVRGRELAAQLVLPRASVGLGWYEAVDEDVIGDAQSVCVIRRCRVRAQVALRVRANPVMPRNWVRQSSVVFRGRHNACAVFLEMDLLVTDRRPRGDA